MYNYNPAAALFLIAFQLIGGFMMLNLFIGVIIDSFTNQKDRMEGYALMVESQREWIGTNLEEFIVTCSFQKRSGWL